MEEVSLFVAATVKGPRRQAGAVMYVLAVETKKGTVTREGTIVREDATENGLTLEALEAALGRLTRPVKLTIWTDSEYVGGAVANGWPEGWEKAGWQTTKGKPVKDAEKWASVLGRIRDCEVSVRIRERHEYSRWMEDQLKKVQIAPVQQKEGKNV